MISLLERMARHLRLTLVGADPAVPARHLRPWSGAIWVIVIVGFAALNYQYLSDSRTNMPLIIAGGIGILGVVPLVFIRDKPLWAWRIGIIAMVLGVIDHPPSEAWPWSPVQVLVTLVILFFIGLREPVGVILWVGAITIALSWAQMGEPNRQNMIGATLLLAAILLVGEQIQRRRRVQQKLRVETERTKIARELHDVVAHSMSLVAVRAETAPYRLGDLPEPARQEFAALAGTARESLNELRRLLGVLRTEGQSERAPQPTLSDVDDLVAAMRAAGMHLSYTPTPIQLPPAAGLTVYRVVQEALSNAGRHAPGAPVTVAIERADKAIVVTVHNGLTRGHAGKPGHGLVGMRERVELLGGSLKTGVVDDVFEVEAVIPLD